MEYRELEAKYKTGTLETIPVNLHSKHGVTVVNMEREVLIAGLGDFVRDYVEHLAIPKWRRSFDWDIVTDKMRRILNQSIVRWHD